MSMTPTCGNGHAEQIGTLIDHRADQQAAVRSALHRQPCRRRVLVGDQPLGRGDEVVEHVLLLQLGAGVVPRLAVFAAAAHVDAGVDESLFEQRDAQRVEAGRGRDVEAAVAVHQRRVVAVEHDALLVDQEHRHLRAVLAGDEDLLGLVLIGVESGNLRRAEHRALPRRDVVAEDAIDG